MGARRVHASWLAATLLLAAALPTWAQTVATFDAVGLRLNLGDEVRIVDRDGRRFEGRVRALPPDALVIDGPTGPRGFTAAATARVQRRGDPLWTGALVGAVPGFALGAQFVAGFSDHEEPQSTYFTAGAIVGLAGAGLGALIDSLHDGLRDVYVAEDRTAVTLAPIGARGWVGLSASLRW